MQFKNTQQYTGTKTKTQIHSIAHRRPYQDQDIRTEYTVVQLGTQILFWNLHLDLYYASRTKGIHNNIPEPRPRPGYTVSLNGGITEKDS